MRILIASGAGGGTAKDRIGKYFHLKEFGEALTKFGIEYKLVREVDYATGFPSKNIRNWFPYNRKFKKLVNEFKPDVIFVDRQAHFGLQAIKAKIPLFVYLRGNYWMEVEMAKKTIYKDPMMRMVVWLRHRIAEKVFRECVGVFMTADYLDEIIKKHHPNTKTYHFLEGINASHWYPAKQMDLKHPCVGMLQDANWWGKTKEMLTLDKVIEEMPDVTFYWAGDGQYRDKILPVLGKHENFQWLGSLDYPDRVREYLSTIDVYALPTGMDTTPLSSREAQLMERPVVATRIGGIPEVVIDKKTGFLVAESDYKGWIEKIRLLVGDKKLAIEIGKAGRQFIIENYNWEIVAKRFVDAATEYLSNKKKLS